MDSCTKIMRFQCWCIRTFKVDCLQPINLIFFPKHSPPAPPCPTLYVGLYGMGMRRPNCTHWSHCYAVLTNVYRRFARQSPALNKRSSGREEDPGAGSNMYINLILMVIVMLMSYRMSLYQRHSNWTIYNLLI